jgi:hypothetical protein
MSVNATGHRSGGSVPSHCRRGVASAVAVAVATVTVTASIRPSRFIVCINGAPGGELPKKVASTASIRHYTS